MRRIIPQRGFSLIEVMAVLVICVLVGLISYNLYSMQQARSQQAAETRQQAAQPPATITSQADLDTSAKVLDQTTLDDSGDTTTLEQEISNL